MDSHSDRSGQQFLRPPQVEPRRRPGSILRPGPQAAQVAVAVGITAALLALVIAGSRWLRTSPRLAVQEVAFVGADRTPAPALGRVRAELRGKSLLALDLARIEKRLRAASPWVRAASVRRLPPGRLEIAVLEHRPIARVDGTALLLGEGGVELPGIPPRPGDDSLPLAFPAPGEGERPSLVRTGELLAVLAAGVDPLLPRVAAIDARTPDNLVVILRDRSYAVHLGHSDFASGLNRFRNAEAVITARYQGLETVDARFRGRVVVAPVVAALKAPAAPAS